MYIVYTFVKKQPFYGNIVGMGDVYCVNHNGIRHNTTTMMSGGFAAFSFGIFFEGMNINLPGNVLIRVAGFCITHAQLINVFWDGLKSPNKHVGPRSLQYLWENLSGIVLWSWCTWRWSTIQLLALVEDGRSQEVCAWRSRWRFTLSPGGSKRWRCL